MKAFFSTHLLNFKNPSGTSRGVLTHKMAYYIIIEHDGVQGIGECGLLKGLSPDDVPEYTQKLQWTCDHITMTPSDLFAELTEFPSIRFALEQAYMDLASGGEKILFPSTWTRGEVGQRINGLIWMGEPHFMRKQIENRLEEGFTCLKMKVGAVGIERELEILQDLRREYDPMTLELRVDANGSLDPFDAPDILNRLAELDIHSIEQPIAPGQWQEMARLCEESPTPIALDEELHGIYDEEEQRELLETIFPQHIILKPSILGGIQSSQHWINMAEERGMGWWITSSLESNIGLNALAQWTYTLGNPIYHGLGTGSLYTNNIHSPLEVREGGIWHSVQQGWDLGLLTNR